MRERFHTPKHRGLVGLPSIVEVREAACNSAEVRNAAAHEVAGVEAETVAKARAQIDRDLTDFARKSARFEAEIARSCS